MENRKLPAILAVVGVVVAVGLFLALNDDTADEDSELGSGASNRNAVSTDPAEEDPPATPKREPEPKPEFAEIELEGGAPAGGVEEIEFTEGEEMRIRVSSDEFAHIHLHGYDVFMDAEPGKPAEFVLLADIGGVFEMEAENTAVQIAEVSVVPG